MHIFSFAKRFTVVAIAAFLLTISVAAAENPFVGRWALTIPGGGAGWLGVTETNGQLKGTLLWGGGSVLPVTSTKVEDGALVVTRVICSGEKKITETIIA